MKMKNIIASGLCLAALASCQKEVVSTNDNTIKFTIVNEIPGENGKAALDNNSVVFAAGDQISVWDGVTNNCFTTAEGGAQAEFTGTAASAPYYVFHSPYNENVTFNGNQVTFEIPDVQVATPGGVDPKALVSIGNGLQKDAVKLYNAVGLIKVEVPAGLIVKEIQVGGGVAVNMAIAGKYVFNANDKAVSSIVEARYVIYLVPGEGKSTIEAGTYYVAVRPKPTYDTGLTVAYVNGNNELCKRQSANRTHAVIERSHILPIGALNTSDYTAITGKSVLRTASDDIQFTGRIKKLAGGSGSAKETNNTIKKVVIKAHTIYPTEHKVDAKCLSSGKGNVQGFGYLDGNTIYVCTEAPYWELQTASGDLFRDFAALEEVVFGDITTETGTSFEYMFRNDGNLKKVDFSKADLSKVVNLSQLCSSSPLLESIDFGTTSVSACANFKGMLSGCTALKYMYLGPNFSISHLSDISMANLMFYQTAYNYGQAPVGSKCKAYMSQSTYDYLRANTGPAFTAARFDFTAVNE